MLCFAKRSHAGRTTRNLHCFSTSRPIRNAFALFVDPALKESCPHYYSRANAILASMFMLDILVIITLLLRWQFVVGSWLAILALVGTFSVLNGSFLVMYSVRFFKPPSNKVLERRLFITGNVLVGIVFACLYGGGLATGLIGSA